MWSGLPDSESRLICALLSAASDVGLISRPVRIATARRHPTSASPNCAKNRDFLFNLDIFIFNGRNRDPMTLEP